MRCEVKCIHCDKWFPSPLKFRDRGEFESSILRGNLTTCPHCGKTTPLEKKQMRMVED